MLFFMCSYSAVSPAPLDPERRVNQLNTDLASATVERDSLGELTTSKTAHTSQKIFQEIRECKQAGLAPDQIQTAIHVVQKTKELFSAKAFRKAGIEKEADRLIADLTLLLPETQPTSTTEAASSSFRTLMQWAKDLKNAEMQKNCWKGRYLVIIKDDGTQEKVSAKEIHHLIQEIKTSIDSGSLTEQQHVAALESLQNLQQLYEKTNSVFFRNTRNENYKELQIATEKIVKIAVQKKMQDVLACHDLTMSQATLLDRGKINPKIISMIFPEITESQLRDPKLV